FFLLFFFSSRRRHTSFSRDWSSDVCSSDLAVWLFAGPPPTESQAQFQLALVADGFNSPVHLTSPPDGTGRLFVVDRIGVVYIIRSEERRVGKESRIRR